MTDVYDVLSERHLADILLPVPEGTRLQFGVVSRAPRVQRRVPGGSHFDELIERAKALRIEYGMPFWYALFISGEALEDGVPMAVLEAAQFHQDIELGSERVVVKDGGLPEKLAKLAATLNQGQVLVLISAMKLPNGRRMHLPMLDLSTKSTRRGGEATVRAALSALGVTGQLAESGRSFHFFGSRLLTEKQHREFLARALLFAPIVDDRWIAHQLISGYSSLRMSRGDKGELPKLLLPL